MKRKPTRTLRDYFAASVLPACIGKCHANWAQSAARAAYRVADEMMKARKSK